ncbi:MAG: restriction endonuclease subunit S [Rubrobacteraceae bacterium]|nr:restriction endonuclease subunit S [Rubrobacteraceae bacterium]
MTEGPYKLPSGWRWVRLGEVVADMQSGFAFRKKGADNGEILHLRPYNIGIDGELDFGQKFLVPKDALPANWSHLEPGDVLFNNTNSVELVGKTALVRERLEAAFSNHLTRVRVRRDLCEGAWLTISLNALWGQGFFAERCNRWIGQAGYNTASLRETVIPLPPLDEQRRIVARIEELMARVREARRLREQAREDAEHLWQSILAETFPRPGSDLPPVWRWVRLGEVCQPTERRDPTKDPSAPFIYVDISAVDNAEGKIVSPRELLGQDAPSRARKVIRRGDVIFATTRPYLKNVAIVRPELDGQICSTGFCVLRANRRVVEPGFLFYLCWSDLVVAQLSGNSMRGASYPAVTDGDVYEALISLPPLDEQRRIVAHLEAVQEKIRALQAAQTETDEHLKRLEQSILDKAFRGEL